MQPFLGQPVPGQPVPGQPVPGQPVPGQPVLGIESSCDETAAAVLDDDGRILAESVASQEAAHAPYGGVVPEIAARAHLALLPEQVRGVMARAGLAFAALGGVAASAGPGLIGGLIVGSQVAKGIALAHGLPYVAVNHLEAHALTARLPGLVEGGAPFPYLLLLVSGGHCQCVAVEGVGSHVRLGTTMDDAAGEAFDKVGKLLGLGWPGGPALEALAARGDPARYAFPRPMLGREGCDFSFSGLKTAVAQEVARQGMGALPSGLAADIAASFQRAVADVLADRAAHAMAMMRARAPAARLLVVAGGVAANGAVRVALRQAAEAAGFTLLAPPVRLCTDNAVMVAWTGIERLRLGLADGLDFAPRPRWGLESLTTVTSPLVADRNQ
jgi:tRNA N6-adenosine threonylcarbamoyltransferase